MKSKFTFFVIALILALAACASADLTPGGRDELGKLVDTQTQATIAAAKLNSANAEATTRAQATREYLILQGQQTRIAQQAVASQTAVAEQVRQTQTVFAQGATATVVARSATQTKSADEARATAQAQNANATATTQTAEFTATAQAQNASATATTAAVIVEQTRVAASATATSNAASAQQTRVTAAAIETRMAEETATLTTKQNWERMTESVRAIGMVAGIVLFVVGGLLFVGFIAYRVITVWSQRRAREYRDANDELVVQLPNGDFVRPGRMPGAYLPTSPARAVPAGALDADATRRDQAVSLMLASNANANDAARVLDDEQLDETTLTPSAPNIQILKQFEPRALALDRQPSRLALPIGTTEQGADMWIPLGTVTHGLIAGSSGMGKTKLLHAWIQAMQYGRSADLALWDGKDGLEFERYAGMTRTTYIPNDELVSFLERTIAEAELRNQLLKAEGATNIAEYNEHRAGERLAHQLLVVDEISAAVELDGASDLIEKIAREARASGVHLISATQHPDTKTISPTILANSLLRIAFSVPHHTNSVAVLGCAGAEKLGGQPGRMLLSYRGTLVRAQAYQVELPMPRGAFPAAREIKQIEQPQSDDDLSEDVRRMARYAVEQGNGRFVVTQIAAALGIRPADVTAAARWLEEKGLLTFVQKDDGGQNAGRHISDALRSMV